MTATTYGNPRMCATIEDWPHGRLRTTAMFSIERKAGKGERGVRITIDPKTGRTSAPKVLTYAVKARIVDGDDGRTYIAEQTAYDFVVIMQGNMQFVAETIHRNDPRYAAVRSLFD